MPPETSRITPFSGKADTMLLKLIIISQPIIIYNAIDNFCHRFISIELKTIPIIVHNVLIPNKVQPILPRSTVKHTGVYVPKIKIKIEQWSKILKTPFAIGFVIE